MTKTFIRNEINNTLHKLNAYKAFTPTKNCSPKRKSKKKTICEARVYIVIILA